jgi:hypothetical protein
MPNFVAWSLLINIACESFFGVWLFVSPGTVPDFPGASMTSDGAATSRRMYASAILALSVSAVCSHISGQFTHPLVAFTVLHLSLVATFLIAKPVALSERIGICLHLVLGVVSVVAAHRSRISCDFAKPKQ